MEEQLLMVAVGSATSLAAYVVGARRFGLSARGLQAALSGMFEGVGMLLIFLALNGAAGMTLIFVLRAITGSFFSIYALDDIAWVGLSLLQGLCFHSWRASR